jgi:hypothetical protein
MGMESLLIIRMRVVRSSCHEVFREPGNPRIGSRRFRKGVVVIERNMS